RSLVRLAQRVFNLAGRRDTPSRNTVGGRELDVVGTPNWRAGVAAAVEELLPLPHHTEIAVVEDRELHDESFLNHGRDLRHVHLKSAIAGNRPDRLIGAREMNAHRRRHREAHGAETSRRDVRIWSLEGIALRDPHLMLTDVRHD